MRSATNEKNLLSLSPPEWQGATPPPAPPIFREPLISVPSRLAGSQGCSQLSPMMESSILPTAALPLGRAWAGSPNSPWPLFHTPSEGPGPSISPHPQTSASGSFWPPSSQSAPGTPSHQHPAILCTLPPIKSSCVLTSPWSLELRAREDSTLEVGAGREGLCLGVEEERGSPQTLVCDEASA